MMLVYEFIFFNISSQAKKLFTTGVIIADDITYTTLLSIYKFVGQYKIITGMSKALPPVNYSVINLVHMGYQ